MIAPAVYPVKCVTYLTGAYFLVLTFYWFPHPLSSLIFSLFNILIGRWGINFKEKFCYRASMINGIVSDHCARTPFVQTLANEGVRLWARFSPILLNTRIHIFSLFTFSLIDILYAFTGSEFTPVYEKHLQAYLSEICYRFNRRFWEKELFDRLVKACISAQTITHGDLVRGQQSIHRY